MIVLLDGVSHPLERRRRMIELARDFNPEFRMSHHGVIINRNATIGGNEMTILGQHQGIDFERSGFHAARGRK